MRVLTREHHYMQFGFEFDKQEATRGYVPSPSSNNTTTLILGPHKLCRPRGQLRSHVDAYRSHERTGDRGLPRRHADARFRLHRQLAETLEHKHRRNPLLLYLTC